MMRATLTAAGALLLAGCASFSADGGFEEVARLTQERTGQPPRFQRNLTDVDSAAQRAAGLLQKPLTADSAVEVALLNNRGLQARFAELGIAEADRVRAGRLRNPSFSFGRLGGAGGVEWDRGVLFDVLGLLTMPTVEALEAGRFAQARLQAADAAVSVAAETRRAFFQAVAAAQLVSYAEQVKEAADSASELARRMLEAGNFNKLDRMREQSFQLDAWAQLARARQQAVVGRERLSRLLGLTGEPAGFELPERLPDLPDLPALQAAALSPIEAEQTAMDKRLDVQMARLSTQATARALGLSQATRFVNVLDAGWQDQRTRGEAPRRGGQITLELPLFDFGATRVARAQATYMQAVHRTAQVALEARSEVRESCSAYRTAYDLARHYRDEVVPLRRRISDENLLRYNGMLGSVFELLSDAREQIASVTASVEALRDFWLADTGLQTALTGHSPAESAGPRSTP